MDTSARVVYVLGTFPKPSETFVLTEMSFLAGRDVQTVVTALKRGPDVGDDRVRPLLAEALYRPPRWLCLVQSVLYGIGGDVRARLHGAAAAHFAERLARVNPVHVHAHFLGAPTLVAHAMARMLGVSFTFSCHASDVFVAGDPTPEEHAAVYDAHRIITCSDYLRDHLLKRRGYPADKVVTVRHGVDLSRIPDLPRPSETSEPPVLGAVGRLVPKKGFHVLLRAAASLVQQGSATLTIVGEGPEQPRLRSLADELGISDKVTFTGQLTWEQTLRTISGFSVLVAPSVRADDGDMDGIPNVLLEAGALGVPVVASRLSGIPEVIEDGRTGILVPPGDEKALARALRQVLSSSSLRESLSSELRARVRRQWDARESVGQLARIFREAAASYASMALDGAEGAQA